MSYASQALEMPDAPDSNDWNLRIEKWPYRGLLWEARNPMKSIGPVVRLGLRALNAEAVGDRLVRGGIFSWWSGISASRFRI